MSSSILILCKLKHSDSMDAMWSEISPTSHHFPSHIQPGWSEAEMLGSFRLLCPLLPSHPACRTHALLDRERETEMETRLLCSGLSKSHTSLGLNLFFCWKIAGEGNLEGRWVKGSLQSPSVLHFMCKFNFLLWTTFISFLPYSVTFSDSPF